jgi:carboxymethylenebutenolidase
MQRIAMLGVWSLCALSATAGAAPIKTATVSFPSGAETAGGYLAAPEAPGKHPAVIVIHDDWGLTDWVKQQANKLAGRGYVALAIDLYHGQATHDPSLAYELMVGTPPERALRDLQASIKYLASRSDVNEDKIGCLGWSAGGKWALLLAENDLFLGACVVNYSPPPADAAEIQKIHAPVLAIFGADDRGIPVSDVRAFEDAMENAHKSVDVQVYPHAGHGFENSDNILGYQEGAAEDAWRRTVAFLDEHLKK